MVIMIGKHNIFKAFQAQCGLTNTRTFNRFEVNNVSTDSTQVMVYLRS